MTITVLSNVFPPRLVLDAGIKGRQMRKNDRVATDSGRMDINEVWPDTLREYIVGFIPMRLEGWEQITALHEVTGGGAKGFLLEDPIDHAVTLANGCMELVSGSTYQLQKRYTIDGHSAERRITRPRASTFVPYYNGAEILSYTLDANTGLVTFDDPVVDVSLLSWTGRFYVPVHFMDDNLDWELAAPGSADQRFVAGPSAILKEVRE